MALVDRLQRTIQNKFAALNTRGVNLGGRLSVALQVYSASKAGSNPLKRTSSFAPLGDPVNLVPIDLQIGQVQRWVDGALRVVGDASLEVARLDQDDNLLTREQLLGRGLEADQRLRYVIGGSDFYTVANGMLEDRDGLTWLMVLKREDQ